MGLIKISILTLYLRLFPNQIFRRLVIGAIIFLIAFTIASTFVIIGDCSPVHFNWSLSRDRAHCLHRWNVILVIACVSVLTDSFILLMPLPIIARLNMATGKKLELLGLFGIGTL